MYTSDRNETHTISVIKYDNIILKRHFSAIVLNPLFIQRVLFIGSGNTACSPLALHCGGKSYLGAQGAAILPVALGSRLNEPLVLSNMLCMHFTILERQKNSNIAILGMNVRTIVYYA